MITLMNPVKKVLISILSFKFHLLLLILAILIPILSYKSINLTLPFKPVVINSYSPNNYQYGLTQIISLGRLTDPKNAYITLRLSFYAKDLDGYQNLFQTAPFNEGLRLEFSGSTAALVLADSLSPGGIKGLNINTDIKTNQWYELYISAKNGDSITASLNGKQIIDYKSTGIELKGSDVLIGQGFDQSRKFHGLIKDITFEDGKYKKLITANDDTHLLRNLLTLLCAFCILCILFNKLQKYKLIENILPPVNYLYDVNDVKFTFNLFILLSLLSFYISNTLLASEFALVKWGLLIFIFLCYPLSVFTFTKKIKKHFFNKLIFLLFFTLYNYHLILNNFSFDIFLFNFICFFVLFFFFTILIFYINNISIYNSILYSLIYNLILIQSFSLVSKLSNWTLLIDNLKKFPYLSSVYFLLTLSFTVFSLFYNTDKRKYTYLNIHLIYLFRIIFNLFPLLLFFIISFRYDSLFDSTISGSPIYHFEYFVGVIRSIQNGGWLLWDTPSQYGFLNLAIASTISPNKPYDSFYIFQGILLFITSSIVYILLSYRFATSFLIKIFIFFIIFFSIFFSDVEFIGPYPFPSSSVVRFFGVYLLVVVFSVFPKFNNTQRYVVSAILPLTFFWSAESALYTTSILIFVLTSLCLHIVKFILSFSIFWKYFGTLFSSFIFSLILIIVYYKFRLGYYPDLTSFYEYAVGYASGFGYVSLNVWGVGNILFIIFIGLIYQLTTEHFSSTPKNTLNIATLSACAGCIFGISTYYIGRPVSQNITAILPLLVITLFIANSVLRGNPLTLGSFMIKTISIPIFFIVLVPFWSPSWFYRTTSFNFFSSSIESSIPFGDIDIDKHLEFINSKGVKNIIFYGDGDDVTAPNPYLKQIETFKFGLWLPTPLQLLETPIKGERRQIYLVRYTCNHDFDSGAIIVKANNKVLQDRFKSLSNEIESLFKVVEVYNIDNYSTIIYKKMLPINCSSL